MGLEHRIQCKQLRFAAWRDLDTARTMALRGHRQATRDHLVRAVLRAAPHGIGARLITRELRNTEPPTLIPDTKYSLGLVRELHETLGRARRYAHEGNGTLLQHHLFRAIGLCGAMGRGLPPTLPQYLRQVYLNTPVEIREWYDKHYAIPSTLPPYPYPT